MLGRRINGRLPDAEGQFLRELFEHPPIADALDSDFVIEVRRSPRAAPEGVFADAYRVETHNAHVMVTGSENDVWIGAQESAVHLRLEGQHALLEVYGAHHLEALMVAFLEALRASGLIPLHAAVAARGGRGTALLGASGRGKTTTLIAALEAGYMPVCEDFALLEPVSAVIYGLDRGLRLLPDTLERLARRHPQVAALEVVRGKTFVPYAEISQRVWSTPLERLWLLERSGEPRLEPLSKREAVMALFSAAGTPLLARSRALAQQHFASLATRLNVARLYVGATPLTMLPES